MLMTLPSKETVSITSEKDVVICRHKIKEFADRIGMRQIDQTKLITAASELIRNITMHADGGKIHIHLISEKLARGVKIIFEDSGPGIADIDKAMKDGFSTKKSLGLGLPGAKRLVNFFEIKSSVGHGTTITIIRWAK
jgi:serine/threonine-protein kinase RsbT